MKSKFPLFAVISLLIAGCGWLPSRQAGTKPEEKKTDGPRLVGRIASIPADKRFVLIQSYETWTIETGSILTTRGLEERTANLRVTGEKLGQFAAADLQSGTVEVGDAVYSLHVPKPAAPPPEEVPSPETSAESLPELPENQQATEP